MLHFLTRLTFLLLLSTLFVHSYSFIMTCDKTNLMIGEKTHLTLTLRYSNLEDYNIEELQFEDFQATLLEDTEKQESNSTWLVTQRYVLTAQKAGSFTLTSPIAHLESIAPMYQERYNRNKYLVKTDIQAKPCSMKVTPLPEGINVSGTYTLDTKIDKQQVTAGEPVRFTIRLKGEGNIEDLSFFTLAIPHTTVYEKSISIDEKEFDIISDINYTIPALSLQYYNQSTKSTELLSSKAFHIEVMTTPSPQKSKTTVLLFLLLALVGLLYYLYRLFSSLAHLDKKATFIKALKKCKTKEALLAKVAPYLGKDRGLDRLIFRLEGVEDCEFVGMRREIVKGFDTTYGVQV